MSKKPLNGARANSRKAVVEPQIERLLTTVEYAEMFGITVNAAARERCRGVGPAFIKKGRRVYYDPAVIRSFLDDCQINSTAEQSK